MKYGGDEPRVRITAWSDADGAHVSVADRGMGIPADELQKIGTRYFRASGSEDIAGTGLGLNLVKMIAEMHGGALEVESALGEGSVFTVSFAADDDSDASRGPATPRPALDLLEQERPANAPPMSRLVYASVAVAPLSDSEIDAIAANGRQANERAGVTGAMLVKNDRIVQALEGEHETVIQLFRSIEREAHHRAAEVLDLAPIDSRLFPDPMMSFDDASAAIRQDTRLAAAIIDALRDPRAE